MAIPDNRLRLPGPLIDFTNDVGLTGQQHDTYPAPGQARYDWARMSFIALLANQASYDMPLNYRLGTPWFDLNTMTLKIRTGSGVAGSDWSPFSDVISLEHTSSGDLTLSAWYATAAAALASIRPQSTYSGRAVNDDVDNIPIPLSVQTAIYAETRPFVWVNGLLVDPRDVQIDPGVCPTKLNLVHHLALNDRFTVLLTNISNFVSGDVLAG